MRSIFFLKDLKLKDYLEKDHLVTSMNANKKKITKLMQ